MPVVTIDPAASERFELKSAPADPNDPNDESGFIVLRPLPYGMKLTRRDKATKMMMRSNPAQAKKAQAESTVELESQTEWAVAFDFANCIIDHNLTDQNQRKLDFSRPLDLKLLNPKVGSEIERLINSLNEDEDELMLEDFTMRSNTSLTDEGKNSTASDGSDQLEIATET